MPYRKYSNSRYRSTRKSGTSYKGKVRSKRSVAKRLSTLERSVEHKIIQYSDIISAGSGTKNPQPFANRTIWSDTPFSLLLNPMSQGTGEHERIGKKVMFKAVSGRMQLEVGIHVDTDFEFHYKLVRTKIHFATDPTITAWNNMFWHTPDDAWSSELLKAINRDWTKQVEILDEDTIHVPQRAGYVDRVLIEFGAKRNMPADYGRGNSRTISDMNSGAIYLLAWVSKDIYQIPFVPHTVNLTGECLITYTDA